MRRSVVIAVAVLAVGALGGGLGMAVGAAGATARHATRDAVVCPLRSSPAIVTCCGPIVARADAAGRIATSAPIGPTGPTGVTGPIPCCSCCGAEPAFCCCCGVGPTPQAAPPVFCCPPTALCVRPLPTIDSSPNPSTEGGAITISGLIGTTGTTGTTGATGASGVTLWQELPGELAYRQLADTTARADGTYSFSIRSGLVTTNRNWYVTNAARQSIVDAQLVSANITVADVVMRGGRVLLRGTVTPSHAGGRLVIQRESGTQWNTVGRARIGRGSRYVAQLRLRGTGSMTLRVELPADRLNAESFSQNLTVTPG